MADATVDVVLGNLQQLLLYDAHLIGDANNQVEKLEKDLHHFKGFLRDTANMQRKDNKLRDIIHQIRDIVYEAEDIIDTFVAQAAEEKSKNYFIRAFHKPVKLANDLEKFDAKAAKIRDEIGKLGLDRGPTVGDGASEKTEAPPVKQDNVVSFENETQKLVGYLKEETEELDVISIIGMPGLGKTKLAREIFCNPEIQFEFHVRIWINVSQEFTMKDVFLTILSHFPGHTWNISDNNLFQKVSHYLESEKFLIVMDDVWTTEDWDKLKIILPRRNSRSKVLITSRNKRVALYANPCRVPHVLRFLSDEESWLLLQYNVFSKPDCPPQLEAIGRRIAKQCNGLPLAIEVIGGILAKKSSASNEMNATVQAWEEVSQSVSKYLNEDPERHMEKIITLSYDTLPFHLKACFLYLAIFPEDFEIPVRKLIQMWIAEGFIQQKTGFSLEETAENYLVDLINRNLVRTDRIKSDGNVKTCRIHDLLREFCKIEAGKEGENFLKEIKSSDGFSEPRLADVQNYRRLCIHSNISNFISSKPSCPCVRSFVCFSKEDFSSPTENYSAILTAFKLLRVLDVKPIIFNKEIPSDLYQLVHLRYITLSFNSSVLPAAFSKLWNIQTLIVYTTTRTLEIKADIWKLFQLRYLKMNASATLSNTGKSSKGGENLQTLGTISPESCSEEVFDRAWNLKNLGIRGRLSLLLDGKRARSFDSLGKLSNLQKLKLLNDVFPNSPSEGKLTALPPAYKFPPKLRSLTLSDTFLDWDTQMSILGMLENLKVLKLKDNAFVGEKWVAADGGFRSLEVLHIGRTDLVIWKASSRHFPKLIHVVLQNCELLKEVPIELADIPSFQVLDLHGTRSAVDSAERIHVKKANQEKVHEFKLSIYE